MGLLDQMMGAASGGHPERKPGLGSTVAAGVVLALLVKGVRQYQASHGGVPGRAPTEGRTFDPGAPAAAGQAGGAGGGLLSGLGGILGGAGGGLGGMIGSLGGAGALGALVSRFQQKGYGQQANSWVGSGQNATIAPHEVEDALGPEAVNALQQQTGLEKPQLLSELSRELPQAIHEATPQGRLPQDDDELHEAARQPAANG
ncbi:YidB family protein [Phenylobacterium soli]|uniref:DUF937 domain-containing protein n=1 Tax=Phenylobacterium soli TaxID=2170551 RepID=A0A328AM12_9CAUL|nr:YidB family protein [Phenylobacterium soli]RAK55471.1 hypothetical protein DJ017_13575 [Phenylobacterium soli]